MSADPAVPVLEVRPIPPGEIRALQMPVVRYPEGARQVGLGGTCAIRVRVDGQGVPYGVEAPGCPPLLRMPALDAALSARFAPWLVDGQPALTDIAWTVEFRTADLTAAGSITDAAVLLPPGSSGDPAAYGSTDQAQALKVAVNMVQVKVAPTRPTYPEEARAQGIEGRCTVRVRIDEAGLPYSVEARACPGVFRDASLRAALSSRFYPYRSDGAPSRVQFDWTFNYAIK